MLCDCGFKFSGPGEFRNCEAFITAEGHSGVICPGCGQAYVGGIPVNLEESRESSQEQDRREQ